MTFSLLLALLVAAIATGAACLVAWHRHHPSLAHHRVRQWWTARGWAWSVHAYLTLHLAIGLLITSATLVAFATLGDLVADQAAITRFDVQFDATLHAMATPVGIRIATALSLIGGPSAMALLGLAGALYLAFVRRDRTLLLGWLFAIGGGGLLDWILKTSFHRPRPLFADPIAHGYGFSFPSGHSMGSLIGFGMLAFIVTRGRHGISFRVAAATIALLLALAVGASRLYLGVHFPSDVLGGFAAGVMWLTACISGIEIACDRSAPADMSSERDAASLARA